MADSNAARRQSNKKFATPLLDESGFTDGHRRVTRSDQRSIHEGLLNKTIGWEEAREANNAIFASRVAYTRELGLDVDNSALALSNFAKEVESKLQAPRFDAFKLIDKLSQQAGTKSGFNWAALGREAGVCFCAVPSGLSFLAGALDAEIRQRAKPKKRAKKADDEPKEKVEETRPEEVINNKSDGDKLSAMEKLNRKVKSRLESRSKEEIAKGIEDPKLDAVRFLFNPKSFTQTVENIFTYSFLIKKGNGAIGVRADHDNNGADKSLFVEWTKAETVNGSARQSVCSFTMADFRRLTEGVDEYDMPNRSSRST